MNATPSPDTPKEDFKKQQRSAHHQQQQQEQQQKQLDDMEDSGTEENESGEDSQYNPNELAGYLKMNSYLFSYIY
jgi:hypothetical protein